jgi:chemotaxis protein CheD
MGSPTITGIFAQRVVVGVGDMSVSNNATITLSTYGLGSCVAIVAYDPIMKIGGLLHVMLPESKLSPAKAAKQPAMFIDTGLPLLLTALRGLRADFARTKVFLAGGATIMCTNDLFKIGERNVAAAQYLLSRYGLQVRHSSLGGTINRTVHLNIGTGEITLKTPLGSETASLA